MPFISRQDEVDRLSKQEVGLDYKPKSTFGETFDASVGKVFDEELSISTFLNREGWSERKETVEALIDSGLIDKQKYTRPGGRFDYNRASIDFDQIKSDYVLDEERKAELKNRREYGQGVIDNGSGFAQFLGAGTAFMLDPVSIATMPISYGVGAATGLRAVGLAAVKAGATEMAAETAIQGFVNIHKDAIESPYSWQDSLANISTAAIAGGLLGGVGMGVREYIGHVRAKSKSLPQDEDLALADATLARMEDTLSSNPLRKEGMTSKELVKADIDYLEGLETRKAATYKPEIEPIQRPKVEGDAKLKSKEKTVLDKTGQADDYAQDMINYRKKFGGETVDMPSLKGITIDEQVRVRETGEVVLVKGDAETIIRRATKRSDQLSALRRCLSA